LFAVLLVSLTMLAGIRWMFEHPYAIHSDEAFYINEAQIDLQAFHTGGLIQLARWMVHGDVSRPPAYRISVLPFTAMFGYHTVMVRIVTLALFVISAWFTYLTTKRLSSPVAGAIAVLVFCLSPAILQNSIFFSTEGPLYLAVAGTFHFLSMYWSDRSEPPGNWIGLGLSIGLGALSKTTFPSIAIPVLVFSAFTAWRYRGGISGLISLVKAGALAFLVAAPWWLKNIRPALAYAIYNNKEWIRHSLGAPSFMMLARWLGAVLVSLLGPGISIVICLVVIAHFQRAMVGKETLLKPVQRTALLACACASIPLVVLQLSGTNFLLRLISPVMIPLAIAVGVLSDTTGWVRYRIPMAAAGVFFFVQFLMLVFPVLFPNKHPEDNGSFNQYPWRIMIRFEQWDWKPLQDISSSCSIVSPRISFVDKGRALNGDIQYGWSNPTDVPRISYLGNGRAFNGSQIQYSWLAQGLAFPDVTWLWRYEDGPIDWQKVLNLAEQRDVVMTAPNYVGQVTDHQDLDNQHNTEFAERLGQDPRFQGPIRLEMGQLDPVEVDVFLKSSLACH
jgi:4-amino-4-deoxy-L-arabinose transferase-like glycosyltransferase